MRLLLNSLELTFSHGGCFVSGITFGSPDRPFDQQISLLSEVAFLPHRAWVAARIVSLPWKSLSTRTRVSGKSGTAEAQWHSGDFR